MQPTKISSPQSGIALIAVLWLTAALGIMVSGVITAVKGEIRLAAQLQRTVVDANVADAAIRVALQQTLHVQKTEFKDIQSSGINIFDRTVEVDLIPLNGLINLNKASVSLLTDAFKYAARLTEKQSTAIAEAIETERKKPNSQGEPTLIHSVEDLLRIPGIDYDIYAQVMPVFTTELENTQKVNPLAAPLAVLQVLAHGKESLAAQVMLTRRTQGDATDTTQLNVEHIQIASTNTITAKATVRSSDNTALVRIWRLALSGDSHGLPWRVLSKDAPHQINVPLPLKHL